MARGTAEIGERRVGKLRGFRWGLKQDQEALLALDSELLVYNYSITQQWGRLLMIHLFKNTLFQYKACSPTRENHTVYCYGKPWNNSLGIWLDRLAVLEQAVCRKA